MERVQHSSLIVHFPVCNNPIQGSSFQMPSGFVGESARGCSDMIQIPSAQKSPGGVNCHWGGLSLLSQACLNEQVKRVSFWVLVPMTLCAG